MADGKNLNGQAVRVAILYHFMRPDDVVSALHFDGMAQDLAAKGWQVEAFPCNRGCRDETKVYTPSEEYRGVRYRRIWRPGFSQKSFLGRLTNSAWMLMAWSRLAFRPKHTRPDVIVVGTDPVFAVATAIVLKTFAPRIKLAHWCFDMHPEAAFVSGVLSENSRLGRMTKAVMKRAYRSCDLIADLGMCMRERLRRYGHTALECELTPWALVEPEKPIEQDSDTRRELFGTARIGLLYSGNFGEAHDFENFLALARELRDNADVHFCFAARGNRFEDLKRAVTEADTNISFAGFAPIEQLEKRLGSADIHLVSLKKEWSGVAVPSKFFGSIASGRPILYSGPKNSAIGSWIAKHRNGWIIDPDNIPETARHIAKLVENSAGLPDLQSHCLTVYKAFFSRKEVMDAWDRHLKSLVQTPRLVA
jgi:colanic acid biosynthesis glycosyl transferase WcaI